MVDYEVLQREWVRFLRSTCLVTEDESVVRLESIVTKGSDGSVTIYGTQVGFGPSLEEKVYQAVRRAMDERKPWWRFW